MEMAYETRTAWKGRGRPPRQPPAKLLDLLRKTARDGMMVTIKLDAPTTAEEISRQAREIAELKKDLTAAQRELGGKVHSQFYPEIVRFYWDPEGIS